MIEIAFIGVSCGLFGYLVANVLTIEGEVLSWYPALIRRLIFASNKKVSQFNYLQFWIAKTTYLCSKCIAGSAALWLSIGRVFSHNNLDYLFFSECFACVTLAIFSAYATDKYV